MLADDLAAVLAGLPGLTAAELARLVGGVSERAVSFALFADHDSFRCANGRPLRWHAASMPSYRPSLAPVPTDSSIVSPTGPALYAWQTEALGAWSRAGRRGVVEAVTGTGKTMVGMAAALEEIQRRGQVLVLVPTIELAHQWIAELAGILRGAARIGLLGAGQAATLATHDVLVAVVNSARALDVRPIRQGGLLVADECHRYGTSVNRLALDGRFRRRLGLSATYARDDEGNADWLDPYFGGTCFRLGYRRAVDETITARFTVTLLGVRFSPVEQARYSELTESMRSLHARLVGRHGVPADPFDAFLRAVGVMAEGDGDGAGVARSWRQTMLERRRLLAETPAKDAAVAALAPAVADADRAIVFTQSIATSERACRILGAAGLRAGVVHSALGREVRRDVLGRFGSGDLEVLAAPRVLDEGIDVPAADLAIIAGASRSRRQMIQRMGRILRRKPDGRRARFAVLFVQGTVEDPAYGAHDVFLEEVTGVADRVSCFPAEALAEGSAARTVSAVRETLLPSWEEDPAR